MQISIPCFSSFLTNGRLTLLFTLFPAMKFLASFCLFWVTGESLMMVEKNGNEAAVAWFLDWDAVQEKNIGQFNIKYYGQVRNIKQLANIYTLFFLFLNEWTFNVVVVYLIFCNDVSGIFLIILNHWRIAFDDWSAWHRSGDWLTA